MRAAIVSVSLFFAVSTGACVDPLVCTDVFAFGLSITLKAEDGTPICSAKVTAIDGDYREELTAFPGCTFSGAGERAGSYRIEVERRGFEKAVVDGVEVNAGECHVEGVTREIELVAKPGCDGLDTAGIYAIVRRNSGARACAANVRAARQDPAHISPVYEPFENVVDLDGGCGYRGAIDQTGTFDVLIQAAGSPDVHRNAVVTDDGCRMQAQRIDVTLE